MAAFQIVPLNVSQCGALDDLVQAAALIVPGNAVSASRDEKIQKLKAIFLVEPPCQQHKDVIKRQLKALTVEKFFIDEVGEGSAILESSFQIMERLKAIGWTFLFTPGGRVAKIHGYPDTLPWQLFRIICRIQRYAFLLHTADATQIEKNRKEIVGQLVEAESRFPQNSDVIALAFQNLEYFDQRALFKREWVTSICKQMSTYVQGNTGQFAFSSGTLALLSHWQRFSQEHAAFKVEATRQLTDAPEDAHLQSQLANIDDTYQRDLCGGILQAVELYKGQFPQRVRDYAKAYQEMVSLAEARKRGGSYMAALFSETERLVWGPLIIAPEKFAQDCALVARGSIVDRIKRELVREKERVRPQKEKDGSDSLGKRVSKGVPSRGKLIRPQTKEKAEHAVPIAPGLKVEEPAIPKAVPAQEAPAESAAAAREEEKAVQGAGTSGAVHDVVDQSPAVGSGLPLVGARYNKNYLYGFHVARWYMDDPDFDPFTHDPEYMEEAAERRKAGIRLHHTLPLALHPVLIQQGAAFEKRDQRAELVRTSFTLVGEIEFPGGLIQKGFHTLAMGADGIIFHSHFTTLSISEILQKMNSDGSFKVDAEPEICAGVVSPGHRRSYQLPDDGSRVCFSSEECIAVRNAQGIVFRALPFPV